MLLGRPWIRSSNVVPSTLHQCLKYCKDGLERMIKDDENPSTIEESHFADAKYYQRKKTKEEVIKALEGLILPLTQVKKVASTPLKGSVTPVQWSKIEHRMLNPKADDLLVKTGSDLVKDVGMAKLPPEVTESKMHGLNKTRRTL
ncbi:hypothetical protein LIER_25063 [Lithospermum erythrorhizon]|uniref:Uncharacterized protein n=1 Tax=Lithospermum erythrorhizon TaxID=34254 RepID=A0AAV3R4L8_LITER